MYMYVHICVLSHVQLFCDPIHCSPPASPAQGILPGKNEARMLEWIAKPFSRGSSQPRNGT